MRDLYTVAYEDDALLVVDKPAGLPTHAAAGVDGPDLYTLVRKRRPELALMHRLDREASGLVLLSKLPEANAALQAQLERHAIERVYTALVAGRLAGERTITRPISERSGGRASVHKRPSPDAQPATSHFAPRASHGNATLVEVRLETGRKHQIRVHAASIGHALVGDKRYGGPPAPRLALHATRLSLRHPLSRAIVQIDSPLPADFSALLAR